MNGQMPRREFIKKSTIATAATAFGAVIAASCEEKKNFPNGKFNVAIVGLRMGRTNLKNLISAGANIVALCDVDETTLEKNVKFFKEENPGVEVPYLFQDYRKMLKKAGSVIDGMVIATPDHTHANITLDAMKAGKHVYTQKPLTHNVYEARTLLKASKKYKNLVTQMGNQGASGEGTQQVCEAIWSGDFGEITRVDAWTNRPIWPQCLNKPEEGEPVPSTLDWDLWLGPAAYRPYHSSYQPFNWRGWNDFGTGALGDMACHIMDVVVRGLKLKYPTQIEASSSRWNKESGPESEMVTFHFPARKAEEKVNMPKVTVTWFDGGLTPPRPADLEVRKVIGNWGGGVVFYGTKGTIITGCYANDTHYLPKEKFNNYVPKKHLRRVKGSHEADWIRACQEDPNKRIAPKSEFAIACPLTEMIAMGTVAPRLAGLYRILDWDGEHMKFTNISENERIKIPTKYKVENKGFPRYVPETEVVNAYEYAQSLIKRTRRTGWELEL